MEMEESTENESQDDGLAAVTAVTATVEAAASGANVSSVDEAAENAEEATGSNDITSQPLGEPEGNRAGAASLALLPTSSVQEQQAANDDGSNEIEIDETNGRNTERSPSQLEDMVEVDFNFLLAEIEAVNNMAESLEEDDIGEFYGFPDDEVAAESHGVVPDDDLFSNSSTNSNMSLADSDLDPRPEGGWHIPPHHFSEAVGELISQAQGTEGGIAALIDSDNLLQRVRSMVFSMDSARNRPSTQSGQTGSGEQGEASNAAAAVEEELMEYRVDGGEEVENENSVRFDTNLPAEHSYFGPNSNRVPGVNYLEVGNRYRMLIFMHQHLLFPGEALPFMINSSIIDEEQENSVLGGRDGIIFGVVFPFLKESGARPQKLFGVTCQIYERGESDREMVFFKSRALQRFVVDWDELQGSPQYIVANPKLKCYGIAKILPEIYLPDPLSCVYMGSLNRFRDIPSMHDKFKRYQVATNPLPAHIYNEFSITDIIAKAREKLEKHKIDTMPTSPIQLSFWLVRNLHLKEKLMHSIFMTDSVNVRLKMIGETLKEIDPLFFCRYCNSCIAECRDLFAMSKYGVQSQYCNSAGYIHETNTVYRVFRNSVILNGEGSTEFSWFPGYQWRIIICKFCSHHIGWKYKAIEPNLVPKEFFGLAGTSVRVGKAIGPSNNIPFVYRNLLRLVSRQME